MILRLLVVAAFLFQSEDDPEAGKPLSCDNFAHSVHKCACGKAMHDKCDMPEPSVWNDHKCDTSCHPERCKCLNKCTT